MKGVVESVVGCLVTENDGKALDIARNLDVFRPMWAHFRTSSKAIPYDKDCSEDLEAILVRYGARDFQSKP